MSRIESFMDEEGRRFVDCWDCDERGLHNVRVYVIADSCEGYDYEYVGKCEVCGSLTFYSECE